MHANKKVLAPNLLRFITFYFSWTVFFFIWFSFLMFTTCFFIDVQWGHFFQIIFDDSIVAHLSLSARTFEMWLSRSLPMGCQQERKQVSTCQSEMHQFLCKYMFTGCGKVAIWKKSERTSEPLKMHILTKHLHVFFPLNATFFPMNVLFKWFARARYQETNWPKFVVARRRATRNG